MYISLITLHGYKLIKITQVQKCIQTYILYALPWALRKYVIMSMGSGNTIVEFFSADIVFKV